MTKITTADCKQELAKLRPDIPGKAWKRTAKLKARGATHPARPLPAGIQADDPAILRTFIAETEDDYYAARVLEIDGRIVHCMIGDEDTEDFTFTNWDITVAVADLKTADFCFTSMLKPKSMGGTIEITICPIAYFKKDGYAWDQHLTPYIEALLPDWLNEVMESCFVIPSGDKRTADQIHAELKGLGFVVLEAYDAQIKQSYGVDA